MKTAAIVPALGIGDALLFMIVSHHLKENGYAVTTFHPDIHQLAPWFPDQHFSPAINATHLATFDCVIIENDNSPKIKAFIEDIRSSLHIFYPTYLERKHGPLHINDTVFDRRLTMAENCAHAAAHLLQIEHLQKVNGIIPPQHLIFRKNAKTVLIHPSSREAKKNWHAAKFINLAKQLVKLGYSPLFCVSPNEEKHWSFLKERELELAVPLSLSDLAALIYESGFVIGNDSLAGHLGSNLNIPTLTIASDKEHMQLWRPGFNDGMIALPPPWLPNKLKKNHWQHFLSSGKVLSQFKKLLA